MKENLSRAASALLCLIFIIYCYDENHIYLFLRRFSQIFLFKFPINLIKTYLDLAYLNGSESEI